MTIFAKTMLLISLLAGILTACNRSTAMPEEPQPTVTAPAEVSPLPPTPTATAVLERIVFYYFVPLTGAALPEGSVVIMPEAYILAPQLSESAYSLDTAADLRTALEFALNDARNGWTGTNLKIIDVTFGDSHAEIVLQGEYFGVGSVTLIAARMQLLFTVFANPAVQSATVTLNGDTIGNLGIAHSLEAKAADYVFTRAEIEAYQAENLYVSP